MDKTSPDGKFSRRSSDVAIDFERQYLNFETLNARIASALTKVIQNSNSKKNVHLEEQKAQKEDRSLRG